MRRAVSGWTMWVATEEETMHAKHPAGLREPPRSGATTTERPSSRTARRERERLVEAVRTALARARMPRPRSR
jgi:hypothetical protein